MRRVRQHLRFPNKPDPPLYSSTFSLLCPSQKRSVGRTFETCSAQKHDVNINTSDEGFCKIDSTSSDPLTQLQRSHPSKRQ